MVPNRSTDEPAIQQIIRNTAKLWFQGGQVILQSTVVVGEQDFDLQPRVAGSTNIVVSDVEHRAFARWPSG